MKYYIHCLKNYTNFSGRARRSEYWFFILFHFIFMIALIFLANLFDGFSLIEDDLNFVESLPLILYGIYFAAVLIPTLAVTARRLHDMGKSGTWVFIYFVPLVGGIGCWFCSSAIANLAGTSGDIILKMKVWMRSAKLAITLHLN